MCAAPRALEDDCSRSGEGSSARRSLPASTRGDPLDKVNARRLSALRPPPSVLNSRLTRTRHLFATFVCFSWSAACHGKGRAAGQQMHSVAWTQVALSGATANRKSGMVVAGWLGRASTTLHCTHHMPHVGSRETLVSFFFLVVFFFLLIPRVTLG